MLGRAWVTGGLVLVVLLSGCVGGKDAATVEQAATNASGLLPNETVAPNGLGRISAFNETNATETKGIGAMTHMHDFWRGRERIDDVAWIDAALIPLPVLPCKKPDNSCTAGGSAPNQDTYPAATDIADFDLAPPPKMGMIYEGTKTVEVKLKSIDTLGGPANPAGHVFFDYLAANDEPGHFRTGGELKLGEPFKIEIKPTDADMPHQTKSLWVFRIYSDSTMGEFGFNITISLVKGYDVVNWPPHPNLYAEKTTREVFNAPVKVASKGSFDGMLFGSDAGWISPKKVISWGTDRVVVDITDAKFAATIPAPPGTPADPKRFVLEARNASSPALMANFPNWATLEDKSSDGRSYHFEIDLSKDRGDAMDTPYAQYSRWGFRLMPVWDDATGCESSDLGAYVNGCQWYPWEMSYTLRVSAIGHSTAGGVELPASATQG